MNNKEVGTLEFIKTHAGVTYHFSTNEYTFSFGPLASYELAWKSVSANQGIIDFSKRNSIRIINNAKN